MSIEEIDGIRERSEIRREESERQAHAQQATGNGRPGGYIDTSPERESSEAAAAAALNSGALAARLDMLAADVRRFDKVQRAALLREASKRLCP